MTPAERRTIIRQARARADQDVTQGIHDLEQSIATAPEWGHRDRSPVPTRAQLAGMLNHLQHSFNTERKKAS